LHCSKKVGQPEDRLVVPKDILPDVNMSMTGKISNPSRGSFGSARWNSQASRALPLREFLHLAGCSRRQRPEHHRLRRLEVREPVASEGDDLVLGRLSAGLELHEGARRLTPFRIRSRDDGGELHRRVRGLLPYLEATAKLLKLLEAIFCLSSKCALKSLNNQADFDSAIRRFDPSRPSQLILLV
jgi:hypothetical protein